MISLAAGAFLFQDLEITGQATACIASWSCSDWSPCIGGTQIKTCYDTNLCGNELSKPPEERSCEADCTPDWTCDEWSECSMGEQDSPEKGTQARVCSDQNNCGTQISMPEGVQECEYKETFEWLFYTMITINILTIILILALLIGLFYKSSEESRKKPGQQQKPSTTSPKTSIPALPMLNANSNAPPQPVSSKQPKTQQSNNPLKMPQPSSTNIQNKPPIGQSSTATMPQNQPPINQAIPQAITPTTPQNNAMLQPKQPPINNAQALPQNQLRQTQPPINPAQNQLPKPIPTSPNELMPKSNSPTNFSQPSFKRK
ncbi:hypothetical protein KAR91_28955 [Candidatus Pacearchaeota archaeon]|nr:hypothetical protein [Candidatus Pacearchaeota archaeon]